MDDIGLENRARAADYLVKTSLKFHKYELEKIGASIRKNLQMIFKELADTLNKESFS
jgi:hypothetical protein